MDQQKIDRINALSRKAKAEGLTEAELTEQAALRREYIDEYKANLRAQLDNTYILNEDGSKQKLQKKAIAKNKKL
ncbi:MAG: DUF896 domain-containing protein [Clostridia bacterium]|nr:DUF896 domain-containing protein [Clostridia bacterium]